MIDLISQIKEEMEKVYLEDNKPIGLGFSGGKDSSPYISFSMGSISVTPLKERTKTVQFMTSDTKVEVPANSEFINSTLKRIEHLALVESVTFYAYSRLGVIQL